MSNQVSLSTSFAADSRSDPAPRTVLQAEAVSAIAEAVRAISIFLVIECSLRGRRCIGRDPLNRPGQALFPRAS